HPRRHVPIDRPHLIPRLILPHLLKIHSLPFEHTMILPRQRLRHHPVRPDLDLPYFFQYFARDHGRGCPSSRLSGIGPTLVCFRYIVRFGKLSVTKCRARNLKPMLFSSEVLMKIRLVYVIPPNIPSGIFAATPVPPFGILNSLVT